MAAKLPRWIVGLDTEDDGLGNPYLFAYVDRAGSWYGETREKALDRLRDLARRLAGRYVVQVWATNLEYDLVNLFGPERVRELVLRFGKSALVGARWRGENVEFRDTVRHLPASVEELGKLVGLQKVNLRMVRSKMLARCLRDTAITYRTAIRLTKIYRRFGAAPKLTLASTAYHVWQERFFKERLMLPCSEVWEAAFAAYHGGRTEAFALGHFRHVNVIDVASMFPWAMTLGRFPVPWGPFERVGFGVKPEPGGLYTARVGVPAHVLGPLPYRTDDGTVYPQGRFTGQFVGDELVNARAAGCDVQILGGYRFFRVVDPFQGYIETLFRKKSRAKGVMRSTYKLMLNALYGKFGQRGERVVAMPAEKFATMTAPPDNFRVWNGLVFFTKTTAPPPWGNQLWAAIVTARARVRLHREMTALKARGCRLLYCDTDSVVFTGHGGRYPKKAKAIGAFELRGEYREIFIVGKKEYGLRDHAGKWEPHVKGIPAAARMEYLKTGTAAFDRPVRIRESSRVGVAANVWRTVRKTRGRLNRGRELQPDGSLAAVVIRED